MTRDYRALCEKLVELDDTVPHNRPGWIQEWTDAIADARALLAEPEVAWEPMPLPGDAEGLAEVFWAEQAAEGPTDKEIISQADKFFAYSDAHMGDPARWEGSDVDLVAFTRHFLARWVRPKPPSLKAQALGALSRADKDALTNPFTGEVVALRTILNKEQSDTIRRALEALPND